MVVAIIEKESPTILCHVMDNAANKQCILTAIYAPTQNRDNYAFWYHLKQLSEAITLPWCIIGDFNKLL